MTFHFYNWEDFQKRIDSAKK